MYRNEPLDETPIAVSGPVSVTLILTMVVTVFLGIYPGPLSEIVNSAAHSFFLH
jgi:NADH-quinone oxidoreductase subunit N